MNLQTYSTASNLRNEAAKYLLSEGIYYQRTDTGLTACINGGFVRFDFTDPPADKRLLANGGAVYRPSSLTEVIQIVRDLQKGVKQNDD